MEKYEVDVLIVGAGVVGLAIASEVAQQDRTVIIVEKNERMGEETSSRNSEVIHGGMYYPTGSLKARLCIEGRRLLYDICEKNQIGHKRVGKFIVATELAQIPSLERLLEKGLENGVDGLKLVDEAYLREEEPRVRAVAALESSQTGIVNSHGLMQYYLTKAERGEANLLCETSVVKIAQTQTGFDVALRQQDGSFIIAQTRVLVNAAGLWADRIAEMAGMNADTHGIRLHFWKGEYFSVRGHQNLVSHLIYPVPEAHATGLGIHVTIDLQGCLRLGPNAIYLPEQRFDYTVDETHRNAFWMAANAYLPDLAEEEIEPGMVGIRPKLQKPGDSPRDFVIAHEAEYGLPGLINLVGIESPGLTASPAIGKMVGKMVNEIL